jgi:hypothetical protein
MGGGRSERTHGARPARDPADREVAAGAVAGLLAGAAMWALAAALAEIGHAPRTPLRLVASSLLGAQALDPALSGAPWIGAALGTLVAVVLGLVFVSLVPERAGLAASTAAGVALGLVAFLAAWWVLARVGAPALHEAGRAHVPAIALLHAAFGIVLGALVPVVRSALD